MAVWHDNHFESGDFTGWTTGGATSPSVVTTAPFQGTYHMSATDTGGYASWARANTTTVTAAPFRFMVRYAAKGDNSVSRPVFIIGNTAQDREAQIRMITDGAGAMTMAASFYNGTSTITSTSTTSVSEGTWYRVEGKVDTSASDWKITWGIATGNGTLTTIDTDWTGSNGNGAGTADYWYIGTFSSTESRQVFIDSVKYANTAGDYPIGPVVTAQTPPYINVTISG